MKTIYDDHYINMLMESLEDPKNKRINISAEILNEVSELIGIEPLAKNRAFPRDHYGTKINQYLLYMILKLGERVVELESKMDNIAPQVN